MLRQRRWCQECGHEQTTRVPPDDKTSADYWDWAEIECRRCKSPALDYGNTVDLSKETQDESLGQRYSGVTSSW